MKNYMTSKYAQFDSTYGHYVNVEKENEIVSVYLNEAVKDFLLDGWKLSEVKGMNDEY